MAVLVRQAILNQVREKKLAHAYLIETNNLRIFEDELKGILKTLLCEEHEEFCDNCQHCRFINEDVHPNIIKIYPEGANIKVGQIDELQKKFKTKAFFGKFNIYVIFEADKLNPMAANSLLKFLEEPEDNIIGILVSTKKDLVMPTITSRCQILSGSLPDDTHGFDSYQDAEKLLYLAKSLRGVLDIKEFLKEIVDKNKIKPIFNYLLTEELSKGKEVNLEKIKIYHRIIDKMKYNVNMELLLEEFIIEMSGVND